MLAISLAYATFIRPIAQLLGVCHRPRPVVLTYHSIHGDEIAGFEWQIRDLSRRAAVVFADATPADKNSVAITFDDALENVFERALPILKTHAMPSTIFVPTGFMGSNPGWIDRGKNPQRAEDEVASEAALLAVDPQLVQLGSHTVTHARLARLTWEPLQRELRDSKQTLERITGREVRQLSLPYGSWNDRVIETAHREGYDRVYANVPVAGGGLVGRVDVSPRDWQWEFRLKASGAYEWMALAGPAKREVRRLFGRVQEA